MGEPVIKVNHVSKDFKFSSARDNTIKSLFTGLMHKAEKEEKIQHALKDISFEVRSGEFFGIVGRNGSGKSTLLKILAGIYQPTKGSSSINGKIVPFIELGVGFNPELTGKENVYMNGAMLGFSEKEVSKFYREVVEFAELEKFMNKKLKNYSSGMQVRLAFSMAIRAEADVLIVDEVLAVGDADFQRKCFDYFKRLKKSKQTVVFVSHDMSAVREYCDRALLINEGKVQKIGDTDEVASEYTRLFLDTTDGDAGEDKNSTRWGTHPSVFSKINFQRKNGSILIKGTLNFKETMDNPLYGFTIKDATGNAIIGTNTRLLKEKVIPQSSGSKVSFSWGFDDILSDGEFTLDVSLLDGSNLDPIDWWEGAARLVVKKEGSSPYFVSPEVIFKTGKLTSNDL